MVASPTNVAPPRRYRLGAPTSGEYQTSLSGPSSSEYTIAEPSGDHAAKSTACCWPPMTRPGPPADDVNDKYGLLLKAPCGKKTTAKPSPRGENVGDPEYGRWPGKSRTTPVFASTNDTTATSLSP